jgi:hypothetical protein
MTQTKKTELIKLIFPHEQGSFVGQKKTFFNIECTAREGDGLYECEVPIERARAELKRKNVWKFVRPEALEDMEEI